MCFIFALAHWRALWHVLPTWKTMRTVVKKRAVNTNKPTNIMKWNSVRFLRQDTKFITILLLDFIHHSVYVSTKDRQIVIFVFLEQTFIHSFIHSFSWMCYDRSTASSKVSSEQTYVLTKQFCSQHNVIFWINKDSVLVKNDQPSCSLITRIQKGHIF